MSEPVPRGQTKLVYVQGADRSPIYVAVDRYTEKQVVVKTYHVPRRELRFRLSDGRLVGGDGYGHYAAMCSPAYDKVIAEHNDRYNAKSRFLKAEDAARKLAQFDMRYLTPAALAHLVTKSIDISNTLDSLLAYANEYVSKR